MQGWIAPYRTPSFVQAVFPFFLWRIPTSRKEIYLTFDDGPVPGPTDMALEHLAAANAKATFFCVGENVQKNGDLFEKVIAGGHAIGNHTFNHLNGWKTTTSQYVQNVEKADDVLSTGGAVNRKLFRPPHGRMTPAQIRVLVGERTIVMWDVLSRDYDQALDKDKCLNNTIRAVRPGSIVVFHDSFKSERNMNYVVPRLIDHFAGLGFTFNALP